MSSSRRPYLYGRSRQSLLAGCHTLPRSPWHCQGDSSSSIRISMILFSIPSLAQVRRQWPLSRPVVVTSVTTSTRDTSARLVSGSWLPLLTPLHWTDGSLASASKTALCQYGHEGDTRLQMRHCDRRRKTKITEYTGRRMNRTRLCGTAVILAAVAAVASGAGTAPPGAQAATRAFSIPPNAIVIRPEIVHVGSTLSSPPSTSACERTLGIACYEPAQIQQAYDLGPLFKAGTDGKGQTIVIVDSFGSPTIGHDLTIFDRAFNLPAPPSLTVIQPAGAVPPYAASNDREGWAGEATLDVEWAHTMAPGARILLVETPTSEDEGTSGFPQIVTAELYVLHHHLGGVISQSFGAPEQTFPTVQALLALRTAYVEAADSVDNVTVLAASGDFGATDVGPDGSTFYDFQASSWPDTDPLVTAVGGTQLHLDVEGDRTSPDSVWNETYNTGANRTAGSSTPNPLAGGGGKSIIFERPT